MLLPTLGSLCAIAAATGLAPAGSRLTAQALGARSSRARASIVGGADASIAGFPFQVALYDPAAGSPAAGFFCGGVIVDATHVITAAHCLAGGPGRREWAGEIEVLAGSTGLDSPDPGSVRDPAVGVAVDPNYDPYTNDYDIGVVTLAHPLWSRHEPTEDRRLGHDRAAGDRSRARCALWRTEQDARHARHRERLG